MIQGVGFDISRREQVSSAFHLVIQVSREKMGRRVIREMLRFSGAT